MSIVDLAACIQEEGESTTHWVRRVSQVLHSSDRINADTVVLTLEGNCRFGPLKLKLGRMKRHCTDMGTLMAALVKYVDSDSTKDPKSDDDKAGKGKRNNNSKGQQHHWQAMVVEASVKRMVTWTLWLIPTRRTMASDARVNQKIAMGHPTLTRTA